eukprot:651483-Pelagomonas_calceolata.AAC.2
MLREVKSCGKMCSYYSLRVCKVQRTEAMQPVDQPLGGGAQGGWPIANCCSAFPGFQMCAGLVAGASIGAVVWFQNAKKWRAAAERERKAGTKNKRATPAGEALHNPGSTLCWLLTAPVCAAPDPLYSKPPGLWPVWGFSILCILLPSSLFLQVRQRACLVPHFQIGHKPSGMEAALAGASRQQLQDESLML